MVNPVNFNIPSRTDQHVYLTVFLGVMTLVWLSTESTYMPLTAALGLAWAFAIAALFVMHNFSQRVLQGRLLWLSAIVFGVFVGVLAAVISFFLMLFKNVQHAHLTPDFPNATLLGMLARAPVWGLAGALFGGAAVFYLYATYEEASES